MSDHPPAISDLRCMIWSSPDMDQWNSLFIEGQYEERACSECHTDLVTEGVRPASHLVHGTDFVRGHGVRAASAGDLCSSCHQQRFCASCHAVAAAVVTPDRLRFDDRAGAALHPPGFRARRRGIAPGRTAVPH